MAQKLTITEILAENAAGRNCGQVVMGCFSDETGYDIDETDKIGAAFGGGMHLASTCGALAGGICVLGMTSETSEEATARTFELGRRFREKHGACTCKELLGVDLTQPGELDKARESGLISSHCPYYMESAIEIVTDILENQ